MQRAHRWGALFLLAKSVSRKGQEVNVQVLLPPLSPPYPYPISLLPLVPCWGDGSFRCSSSPPTAPIPPTLFFRAAQSRVAQRSKRRESELEGERCGSSTNALWFVDGFRYMSVVFSSVSASSAASSAFSAPLFPRWSGQRWSYGGHGRKRLASLASHGGGSYDSPPSPPSPFSPPSPSMEEGATTRKRCRERG